MASVIKSTRTLLKDAVTSLAPSGVAVFEHWVPSIVKEDIGGTQIHVTVDNRSTVLVGRGVKRTTFEAWLMIIAPLGIGSASENTVAESLHELADSLIESQLGMSLSPKLTITKAEQVVGTSPEYWRDFRQCASFVKLTIEGT